MVELWEAVTISEIIAAFNQDENEGPDLDELLVNYGVQSGKIFSELESYALELIDNNFESKRTYEIYRSVGRHQFDTLGYDESNREKYNLNGQQAITYETMIEIQDAKLDCYKTILAACRTHDLNQLTLCIATAGHGQELAIHLIDQVHMRNVDAAIIPEIQEDGEENDETSNNVGLRIAIFWTVFILVIAFLILALVVQFF